MAKLKTGRHTSSIKTQRMAERRAAHNRAVKRGARDVTKELATVAATKDKAKAEELYRKTCSAWDKAAKTGVIHWKAAARKKSRLALQMKKLLEGKHVEPAQGKKAKKSNRPAPAPAVAAA
ncbi:MAG: 30S ribosomal protein S20 [Elusimicrobiota bacterium]|jgi:small subunit ribosomal protein S20